MLLGVRRFHATRSLTAAAARYVTLRLRKRLVDRRTLQRAWGPLRARFKSSTPNDAPLIASLAVTDRCPLACGHCSADAGDGQELPFDRLAATLDFLVASGCPVIALTGGEPLTRADLPALLERIPPSSVSMLFTSGVGLRDEVVSVLEQGPHRVVSVSIDHHRAEEHDRRRGFDGAHAAALAAIDRLAGRIAEVHVTTLVTRDRLDRSSLTAFARDMRHRGVTCLQIFVPRLVGRQRARAVEALTGEEEQSLRRLAADLNADPKAPLSVAYPTLQQNAGLGCCAGYARVYVDAAGNVCPCDFAPIPFGNLRDEPFAAIWARMRAQFPTPGCGCLAPFDELPAGVVEGRDTPGVWRQWGESTYRSLTTAFSFAAVVLEDPPHG
jgi:MoaA/NifB/PqqE/SkfB family radical SAM enzyme